MVCGIIESDHRIATAAAASLHAGIPGDCTLQHWTTGEGFLRDAPTVSGQLSLLLIDLVLSGIEPTELLQQIYPPPCPVLALCRPQSENLLLKAIPYGISGYVDTTALDTTADAAQILLHGGAILPHALIEQLLWQSPAAPFQATPIPLSRRERDVLKLLVIGNSVVQAASLLGISPHTLRVHVKNIYRKLHVHNRAQLVARSQGLELH